MRDRNASRLARLVFGITVIAFAGALTLSLLNRSTGGGTPGQRDASTAGSMLFYTALISFSVVGILISSRQPRNKIAWIFLAIGLSWELWWLGASYLQYGLITNRGTVPAPALVAALSTWLWAPGIGLMGTFLILLFPDGHLSTQRWRPIAWLSGFGLVSISLTDIFQVGSLSNMGFPGIRNPLAIQALEPILKVTGFTLVLLPICMIASAASLIQRFRRSRGVERLQLKWFAAASGAVAAGYVLFWLVTLPFGSDTAAPLWAQIVEFAALCCFVLIPIAAGIAILKHRLFDIDVVINKTVVFGALAGFITAVYVAIVVGIGHVIGSGDKPNLGLSILATAIVAIAFQPVRERVQHFANRLVYGQRATPYEVLAEFSGKVAETYATEDVLPKMARTVAEGTGAAHAEVWLRFQDHLRPVASWPLDLAQHLHAVSSIDGAFPSFDGTDKAIAVRHQDELLGALTVTKPAGEPLNPAEEKLLTGLASQAGLVLRNVGLTSELLVRLEELNASRQRLVTAQDQERRRLERNLHDGAQQNLVALKMRLALARRLTEQDPSNAEEVIGNLELDADDALNTLRDFARGIYPPLLADQGLHAALEAQARKAPIPVEVHSEGVSRYPQEIESAVYFCCLEAIQNISKYAHATTAIVMLEQREEGLAFSVTDDGVGFDPASTTRGSGTQNMSDRLEALEGSLTIESSSGKGTTVAGSLPVMALELAT